MTGILIGSERDKVIRFFRQMEKAKITPVRPNVCPQCGLGSERNPGQIS